MSTRQADLDGVEAKLNEGWEMVAASSDLYSYHIFLVKEEDK